ncbi:MAG TPA: cytochrome c oxidase assembly protein [Candidatus Aquilonibacter sp.]|nr:cytochrome c oxidase assembly protein [Candidatus Aquilonibacter sp.]
MLRFGLCAFAAAAFAAVALSPALDHLADRSFAWHMVQHMLLIFAVPFFLLLAHPYRVLSRFASAPVQAAVVRFSRRFEAVAHPAVALAVFVATLWITHFSPLYELSLEREWVHIGEHALYLFAGLLFWAPVLAPPPLRPIPYPARLLYLLVALPQGALIAFAIAGSRRVLYAHYASNPAALADQSNAAAVMWVAGGLILFTAFIGTFGAWAFRESRYAQPSTGAIS